MAQPENSWRASTEEASEMAYDRPVERTKRDVCRQQAAEITAAQYSTWGRRILHRQIARFTGVERELGRVYLGELLDEAVAERIAAFLAREEPLTSLTARGWYVASLVHSFRDLVRAPRAVDGRAGEIWSYRHRTRRPPEPDGDSDENAHGAVGAGEIPDPNVDIAAGAEDRFSVRALCHRALGAAREPGGTPAQRLRRVEIANAAIVYIRLVTGIEAPREGLRCERHIAGGNDDSGAAWDAAAVADVRLIAWAGQDRMTPTNRRVAVHRIREHIKELLAELGTWEHHS